MIKILSSTWTTLPKGFTATTLAMTPGTILLGGSEGKRYQASMTSEPLTFEALPFPDVVTRITGYVEAEDVEFNAAYIDRSRDPAQCAMHMMEYQGGSYGLLIHPDLHHAHRIEYLVSPHDPDMAFADSYVLRGDTVITGSYMELEHFQRINAQWVRHPIAFPAKENFAVIDLALAHDASTLIVVTDSPLVGTVRFTLADGRFAYDGRVDAHLIGAQYIDEHRMLTTSMRESRELHMWDGPFWQENTPSRQLILPEGCRFFTIIEELLIVIVGTTCQVLRLADNQLMTSCELPLSVHKYSTLDVACAGDRLVVLAEHQVGVCLLDRAITTTRPLSTTPYLPRPPGYDEAKRVFAQYRGHNMDQNAYNFMNQIQALDVDHDSAGDWLWRGFREGLVALSIHFHVTLERDPDSFSADDVLAFMEVIDHGDINAWASVASMVQAKLRGHEHRFVLAWAKTRAYLRADLGYFLATCRLLPVHVLPPLSLLRAAASLAHLPLARHPNTSYPSQLDAILRLYPEADVAQAILTYIAGEEYFGDEMAQWFELVWPHAQPEHRVMLLTKISREENVLWFGDFFRTHALDSATRDALEHQLARQLVVDLGLNPFFASNRPYETYTMLAAAVVLGRDSARRRVGLSAIGGAVFARALALGEEFPTMCGLTPPLRDLMSELFGA